MPKTKFYNAKNYQLFFITEVTGEKNSRVGSSLNLNHFASPCAEPTESQKKLSPIFSH